MSLSDILGETQGLEEKDVGELIEKIIDKLLDEKNVLQLTDLSESEIREVAELLAIADTFNVMFIKKYVKYVLLLKISKKRAGRKELLNAIKYLAVVFHQEKEDKGGILKRIIR